MRSLLVILAIMMSGCFGASGDGQLSQDEARAVAQQAVEDFARDFSSVGGGDLRIVRGEFGTSNTGFGFSNASFEAEWGAQGTARVELTVRTDGGAFSIGLHCGARKTIISYGDKRIEARPAPERTCLDALQEDSASASVGQLDGLEVGHVTAHGDGSVTATFSSSDGNMTAHIDRQGRLSRIDLDSATDGGFMEAEYGARRSITIPGATARMPALVFGAGFFDGSLYAWSAASAQEAVPFSEIEVRIQDPANQTAAAFTPRSGQQTDAGFTFDYVDDGDGLFGLNDSFTIRHDAWTRADQHDVLVWDVWADRAVGDVPVPAPAWALLVFALAAIAWARR